MNLEESDAFKEEIEQNSRHKKTVMLSIIICVILLVLFIILIAYIKYKDSKTLKLFIDGKQVPISETLYYEKNEKHYVSIKEFAELLGYTYTNGSEDSESDDSGYFDTGYEIVSVTANDNKYIKTINVTKDEEIIEGLSIEAFPENTNKSDKKKYSETFFIDDSIKINDGQLYIAEDYLADMFNVNFTWTEYRIKFYTLKELIEDASTVISKAGYTEVSGYYENLRAVVNGFAVVGNGSQSYGVISLSDGKEIFGLKYSSVKYVQNSNEFYVKTQEGMMGILNSEGKIIINPTEYEDISLLDEKNGLYKVKKKDEDEYGVLNKKGEIAVHAEYDDIGYDITNYNVSETESPYIWFEKCIPVRKSGKYGLYRKDGELILPHKGNREETNKIEFPYEGFGYLSTEEKTSGNEESVLLIPASSGIQGIVIKYNGLYGIYDINRENIIVTCIYNKIYAITKSGETNYYMELERGKDTVETISLEEYIEDNGLKNVDKSGNLINDADTKNTSNTNETDSEEQEDRDVSNTAIIIEDSSTSDNDVYENNDNNNEE